MPDQNRTISYKQLVDRQKFYQEKALQIEKDFIFANEKIARLEEEMELQANTYKSNEEAYHRLKKQVTEIKQENEHLETENQNLKQRQTELETYIKSLEGQQSKYADSQDDKRIKDYERLLAEVQRDLTEKDEAIAVYKKRLNVLEKRLKMNGDSVLTKRPDLNDDSTVNQKTEMQAIAFSDYAIIMSKQRCLIRGDFVIQNTGVKTLGTPYICFRFTPGDAAEIKGRILSLEHADNKQLDPGNQRIQWAFLDNDWASEAKERGEVWIYPAHPSTIQAGEEVSLSDFQIPIETKYYDYISIETFVYFQEPDYKIKSANQMLINF